jgi:D-glycerate 3-kinase
MTPRVHPSRRQVPTDHGASYAPALVADVLDDALMHEVRVYAITGVQGCGKSTLAAQVAALALQRGITTAVLSIDDFYLGRRERSQLGRDVHPLLATRGPPGTHDVALACEVIDRLREGAPTRVPRFDKIADRRLPPSRWPVKRDVDLVLFEGWFLKAPAQPASDLHEPINALESDEDSDRTWRAYCNESLRSDYPALWRRLDRMLLLQAPRFDVVPTWRWQQEQALQAANPGRRTMDRPQVERFVQLFERVSRHALLALPPIADRMILLDSTRHPIGQSLA